LIIFIFQKILEAFDGTGLAGIAVGQNAQGTPFKQKERQAHTRTERPNVF
jgi:hypothetical protein